MAIDGNSGTVNPAVADGKVYIGSTDHKVYCLDAESGALIWNYNIGNPEYGVNSSPAVADGKVYVGSHDHNVYCFGLPASSSPMPSPSPISSSTLT